MTAHTFSQVLPNPGLLNPALAYAASCLGAFLGLRCVTRARDSGPAGRAAWLTLAAIAVGATGIWAAHFIAILGFTVGGQPAYCNVQVVIASLVLAILVAGLALFVIGYGDGRWRNLASAGTVLGVGVAGPHYLGLAGLRVPDAISYKPPLVLASVAIAIVAGTAALWAGTRARGLFTRVVASMIMGGGVSGMHYAAMRAMKTAPAGPLAMLPGVTQASYFLPLVIGLTAVTFFIAVAVCAPRPDPEPAPDAAY